jgi:hypothetical protein
MSAVWLQSPDVKYLFTPGVTSNTPNFTLTLHFITHMSYLNYTR